MTDAFDRERHEALRTIAQFGNWADICSCGNPEEFYQQLLHGLNSYEPSGRRPRPDDERLDLANPTHLMLAYILDCWALTEHGTSINGGWLTRDGARLRAALRRVDLVADLHDTLPDGDWWVHELDLYPHGYDGSGVHSVGHWREERRAAKPGPDAPKEARAPEHVVDLLLAIMRPHRGPRLGSVEYARSARAEARDYADRWWFEAFHAGAAYGMSVQPARMVLGNNLLAAP